MNKKCVSKILEEDRGWNDIKDSLPTDTSRPVVIRFVNNHYAYYETDTEIYYAEDIKLAKCIKDYDDPENISKCSWSIIPPYPKFDYSPLSNFDKISEGSVVTHWAEVSDDELEDWNNRFNIVDDYLTLNIDVDDDHMELMYRALLYGMGAIGTAYSREKSDELMAFHVVIHDLLNSMDKNIMIKNGEEVSKAVDYDLANEDGTVNEELSKVIGTDKITPLEDTIKHNESMSRLINSLKVINVSESKGYVEKLLNDFLHEFGVPGNLNITFKEDE